MRMTVIYLSGDFNEASDIVNRVNADLANVSHWASRNGLLVNAAKTQALWVGSRNFMSRLASLHLPDIVLNGVVIPPSNSVKVLGTTLDNTLSWREQCNITASKSFGALARLRKCQAYLPQSTKLILIKTLVFPYLNYCAGIFLGLSKELKLKLSRCKNAALRFATDSADYRDTEILTYESRRDFLAICLLARIIGTNVPQHLTELFNFISPEELGGLRRSPLDLEINKFKLEYFRGSFRIKAAYLWNDIPHEIRAWYKRPNGFKYRLYKHFLTVP